MGSIFFPEFAGPFEDGAGPHALALRVEGRHLNPGARLHGALSMSMLELAAARVAAAAAGSARVIFPLTSHYEFLGAAEQGDRVIAQASLARATRTLMFLDARLTGERGLLSRATIIHGFGTSKIATAKKIAAVPPSLPPEYIVSPRAHDPYATLLGPVHEFNGRQDQIHGALQMADRHVAPLAPGGCFEGARLLADLFLGRAAHRGAASRAAVTLSLTLNYLAPLTASDLLFATTRLDGTTALTAHVSGSFEARGEVVMTASGVWKIVGSA